MTAFSPTLIRRWTGLRSGMSTASMLVLTGASAKLKAIGTFLMVMLGAKICGTTFLNRFPAFGNLTLSSASLGRPIWAVFGATLFITMWARQILLKRATGFMTACGA